MRNKILAACLILLLAVPLFGKEAPSRGTAPDATAVVDFNSWIDANQILMFVTNKGSFAYDNNGFLGKNDGLYFPFTSLEDLAAGRNVTSAIFAGSIWCGAIDAATGDTLVTSGQHWTDWSPGPLDGSGEPPSDAATNQDYRVYKLYSDSLADNPNEDYLEWPIDQGAPFEVTLTGDTVPAMMGDQMMWSVYNDMDPSAHSHAQGTVGEGMGLEVRQTAFAFDRVGALANMVFLRFRMYNKGPYDLDDMHVSIWADPDLGDAGDDFVGCDTLTSLGFCYNDGTDPNYGSAPPAVGYDFFQGPMVPGDAGDTALMWGFQEFPGMKNLGMSSFNKYINGTDPESYVDTWEYMNGLDASKDPIEPVTDPVTGDTTVYYGNGDPVTGEGFIDVNSSDRRWMQTTGPFDFAQGDSTEIVVAVILGQGGGPLGSISALRTVDDYAQGVYDAGFQLPAPPAKPDATVDNYSGQVVISWGTASEDDPGDYPFEGYALMQGAGPGGPWTDTLGFFDIVNGIDVIIDTVFNTTAGQFFKYVAKPGLDEGLVHEYSATRDASTGAPLVNYRKYYYKVEAYSYDPSRPAGDKTLTSATVLEAMPQSQLTGIDLNSTAMDTITGITQWGLSDGSVTVEVIDPKDVTGSDYKVGFTDYYVELELDTVVLEPLEIDTTYDTIWGDVWHVVDTILGDSIIRNQTNQGTEGEYYYPTADGIRVRVFGPPFEINTVVWTGPNEDDVPLSGVNFGGSAYGGGISTGDFFFGSTVGGAGMKKCEIRWVAPGTGQSAYVYRRDDGYNYYGYHPNQDFTVWDVTSDPERQLNFAFVENYDPADDEGQEADSVWNPAEQLTAGGEVAPQGGREYMFILSSDYSDSEQPEYAVDGACFGFDAVIAGWLHGNADSLGNPILPQAGDVLTITPYYVNSPDIEYTFSTAGLSWDVQQTGPEERLSNIKAVPNPYYLYSENDESTFNRTLKFINLPSQCTITIYNLAGDLVRTLVKEDASATEMRWDLLNEFSIPVGSGIYIYVVDSPDFGEKVGKMAVFTEVELLNQY